MDYSKELLEFIKKSPSSFHSIQSIKEILTSDGFEELDETKIFSLSKGKKYFVTRNQSSIIAFKIVCLIVCFYVEVLNSTVLNDSKHSKSSRSYSNSFSVTVEITLKFTFVCHADG